MYGQILSRHLQMAESFFYFIFVAHFTTGGDIPGWQIDGRGYVRDGFVRDSENSDVVYNSQYIIIILHH